MTLFPNCNTTVVLFLFVNKGGFVQCFNGVNDKLTAISYFAVRSQYLINPDFIGEGYGSFQIRGISRYNDLFPGGFIHIAVIITTLPLPVNLHILLIIKH